MVASCKHLYYALPNLDIYLAVRSGPHGLDRSGPWSGPLLLLRPTQTGPDRTRPDRGNTSWGTSFIVKPRDSVTQSEFKRVGITYLEQDVSIRTRAEGQGPLAGASSKSWS
jgi:hypothetical protein